MLLQRVLTAFVLVPLVLLIIWLAPEPVFAAIGGIAFLAATWEWSALSGLREPAGRVALLLFVACLLIILWWMRATVLAPLTLAAGIVWWLVASVWLRHFPFGAAPTSENRAIKLAAGVFVIVPAWMALVSMHSHAPNGHWWTLLALVIVWASDIGAYSSGRTFGKRKLAPQISPGKTWAGAYGAMVAGLLVAQIGGWLLGVRGAQLISLALLTAITVAVSIVGDLIESLMKRHAQVKDSGTIFPGHGGLMDRMDSVFAATPVFAAGLLLLGL